MGRRTVVLVACSAITASAMAGIPASTALAGDAGTSDLSHVVGVVQPYLGFDTLDASQDGDRTTATFDGIQSLAAGPGVLYVADPGVVDNHPGPPPYPAGLIRRIDLSTGVVSTLDVDVGLPNILVYVGGDLYVQSFSLDIESWTVWKLPGAEGPPEPLVSGTVLEEAPSGFAADGQNLYLTLQNPQNPEQGLTWGARLIQISLPALSRTELWSFPAGTNGYGYPELQGLAYDSGTGLLYGTQYLGLEQPPGFSSTLYSFDPSDPSSGPSVVLSLPGHGQAYFAFGGATGGASTEGWILLSGPATTAWIGNGDAGLVAVDPSGSSSPVILAGNAFGGLGCDWSALIGPEHPGRQASWVPGKMVLTDQGLFVADRNPNLYCDQEDRTVNWASQFLRRVDVLSDQEPPTPGDLTSDDARGTSQRATSVTRATAARKFDLLLPATDDVSGVKSMRFSDAAKSTCAELTAPAAGVWFTYQAAMCLRVASRDLRVQFRDWVGRVTSWAPVFLHCAKIDAVVGTTVRTERVAIGNRCPWRMPLTGWKLSNGGNRYMFPRFSLAAGATVTVHTRRGVDSAKDLFWGRAQRAWQHVVRLVTPMGRIADELRR